MVNKGGAVVRALASHHCGPGSNPGVDAICGSSLLLVLSIAPRGFSLGTLVFPSPQKPSFSNSDSSRNQGDEEPLRVDVLLPNRHLFIYRKADSCKKHKCGLKNIRIRVDIA